MLCASTPQVLATNHRVGIHVTKDIVLSKTPQVEFQKTDVTSNLTPGLGQTLLIEMTTLFQGQPGHFNGPE